MLTNTVVPPKLTATRPNNVVLCFPRVGTTNRSMAAIACAWLRKNVFQVCDGDPPRTMYFETVDWATSKAEHQQLAVDPRCSPPRVFLAHPSDEIAQLSIDLWPPCPLP